MAHLIYLLILKLILIGHGGQPISTAVLKPEKKGPRVIPVNYFISPVRHTILLAGTFCELRPNHFHTGIDIKSSAGSEGDPILAAADGFVSRISIGPDGYGNALYIDHPNGYTTVYGHLRDFNAHLETYILQEQTKLQKFEVELYPSKGQFMIRQGDQIGTMGNSGSSRGPHLHYEIRDTRTENPLNPLLFGLAVSDTEAPLINYARIYTLDEAIKEYQATNILVSKRGGRWVPRQGDTIRVRSNLAGLGINTRDGMQGNWNRNGVYKINMYIDDVLSYTVKMDSVSFFKTRMINAHLDYPEQKNKKNYVHRCFTMPGNTLPIISYQEERGIIKLNAEKARKINFEVFDYNLNRSDMQLFVKKDTNALTVTQKQFNYSLPYDKDHRLRNDQAEVFFPKNTFFRNTDLYFGPGAESSRRFYSAVHEIGNPDIPVFDYFDLWINPDEIPAYLRPKAFIGSYENPSRIYNWGGEWQNGLHQTDVGQGDRLYARVKALGKYFVAVDTLKPVVTPVIFGANMTRARRIVFRIDDNVLPKGQAPLLRYTAYINDQWIRMIYDLKTKSLTYHFPSGFPKGTHTFKLEVSDAVNNINTYTGTFIK